MKNILIIVVSCVLFSCSKQEPESLGFGQAYNNNQVLKFGALLAGEQEVPTHSSNGYGTFSASLNRVSNKLDYQLTYGASKGTVFSPTVIHIHKGRPGIDGNQFIVFDLGEARTNPVAGEISLTESQLDDLEAGLLYIHIHSSIFPEGDIRGQISKK